MLEFIQVGDLGRNRDKYIYKLDSSVGEGNWYWAFRVGGKLYSWDLGMQLYEDAYWNIFFNRPKLAEGLIKNYSNVCVFGGKDIAAMDYRDQWNKEDHYADIAIRRVLRRMGMLFDKEHKGKLFKLKDTPLDDSRVSFHLSSLSIPGESVRAWLYRSRVVAVAPKREDKIKLAGIFVQ